jgi:hypothetical protein
MTGTRLGQVPGVDYWQSRVFNCREFCPLACACFVCTVLRLWPSGGPLEHQPTFLVNRVTHHCLRACQEIQGGTGCHSVRETSESR